MATYGLYSNLFGIPQVSETYAAIFAPDFILVIGLREDATAKANGMRTGVWETETGGIVSVPRCRKLKACSPSIECKES